MYVPDLNMYPVLWCNCIQLFQKVFLEKNKQASSIVGRFSGYSYLTLGFQGNQRKCHFRTRQSGFDELFYLFDILEFNDYRIPRYASRSSCALLSNSLS